MVSIVSVKRSTIEPRVPLAPAAVADDQRDAVGFVP